MYCKKCGNKIENDSVFCSKCGQKIKGQFSNSTESVFNNISKDDGDKIISENVVYNVETTRAKKKKVIMTFIFTIAVVLSVLIPLIIKSTSVTEVPNHYFDFGSIRVSNPASDPNDKSFYVDVTLVCDVKVYDLVVDVYIYSGNKFVTKFKQEENSTLTKSTKAIKIEFEDKSLIDMGKYDYFFVANAKTRDKLPSIEYGTVTFLNYDDSVYKTIIVEKRAGRTYLYPEPVRNGYTFDGWYYDSNYKQKFYMDEQHIYIDEYENVVLYPKWKKN